MELIMITKIRAAILLSSFFFVSQSALGDIYKCKKDGKTEYQAKPCANLQLEASKLKLDSHKQSDKKKISVKFNSMPVLNVLQVIADASGNKLIYDSSIERISKPQSLHYKDTPWDVLLDIVAKRNLLDIKVENQTIYVRKYKDNDSVMVVYPSKDEKAKTLK